MAILGGRVSGLSAAHELVERGSNVTIFENKIFRMEKPGRYLFPIQVQMAETIFMENTVSVSFLGTSDGLTECKKIDDWRTKECAT